MYKNDEVYGSTDVAFKKNTCVDSMGLWYLIYETQRDLRRQMVNLNFLFYWHLHKPVIYLVIFSESHNLRVCGWIGHYLTPMCQMLNLGSFNLYYVLNMFGEFNGNWYIVVFVLTQDTSGRCKGIIENHFDEMLPSAGRTDHLPHTGKTRTLQQTVWFFCNMTGVKMFK
jgi:hypothetical protein